MLQTLGPTISFKHSKTKSLCCNITLLFDIHPHPFCQRPLVLQHYTTRTEPNRTAMSHEPNRTEPPCHANRNEPACWWTEPPLFEVSTNRNEPKRTEAFLYYAYACMFLIFWVCLYVSGVLKNWNIGSMTWCHQPSAGIPYDSNPLIHAGPVHKVSISQIPSVTQQSYGNGKFIWFTLIYIDLLYLLKTVMFRGCVTHYITRWIHRYTMVHGFDRDDIRASDSTQRVGGYLTGAETLEKLPYPPVN